MKVYTEVNYIWKDNKLVQTDSKSFDYEGEIESCHWYHRHSTTVSIPTVNDVKDVIKKGPGGDLKKVVDKVYGGSTKDAVTTTQNNYKDAEKIVSAQYDKTKKAHQTNMEYLKAYLVQSSGLGGGGDDGSGNTTDEEGLIGAGSRRNVAGAATNASGKSGKNKRVIREKNMPSLINQSLQKRLTA
jgi:hypothetical protein